MSQECSHIGFGKTRLTNEIAHMVQPILENFECEIVQVVINYTKTSKLTIIVGKKNYDILSLDECAEISRQISALLDIEDPMSGEYVLEVSSPGIDRLLVRDKDFCFYAGHEVLIKTRDPINGKKKFKGYINKFCKNMIFLDLIEENIQIEIAFDNIEKAKLVFTDALLASGKASN